MKQAAPLAHQGGRFVGRVEDYRRFRPRYPKRILELLKRDADLTSGSEIADIAAGTGLFTELFLEHGNTVTAVEPNDEMREACRRLLARYPRLGLVNGTAESTGLPTQSFDFLTVAQAFHWFDVDSCRREFMRVLRPGGWCVIVFNQRRVSGDAFHNGFEEITRRHNIDYSRVSERYPDESLLRQFFAPNKMHFHTLKNNQLLTREGLLGRTLSSSFMPKSDHPGFSALQTDLDKLFRASEIDGVVQLDYSCGISYGQLS